MKEDAHHTSAGLAVETSVFVVLMGAWMWGILALGAYATAAQGPPSGDEGYSRGALVSCPAPHEPGGESAGSSVAGGVCRPEVRALSAGTSRQPGRGLPGGRIREP